VLVAVLPSQTSRDAADTVRFLLECRNLNGVKRCVVVSLCSRVLRVGGGMVIGSGALPGNLDCVPVRVAVEAAGGGREWSSFRIDVDVAPRGAGIAMEGTTVVSG
jgi:hypothetical protein